MCLPDSRRHASRQTRRPSLACTVPLVVALLVSGWATPAAASSLVEGRFALLRTQDAAVARVAYRLATENLDLCRQAAASQPGFIMHDIAQYDPADRPGAARAYRLGSRIAVMAVVEGSPADRAGLRADDQLEAVNGRGLDTARNDGPATARFVERAQWVVAEEMRKGAVTLHVSGAGGGRDVRFTAAAGCPSQVELVPGSTINAWADGARVMVTDAIVARCPTDNELAIVIAHEMAHNILGHRKRLARAGIATSSLLPISAVGLAMVRATEEEADRFAVRMTAAAGYDLGGTAPFVGGLLEANGLSNDAASTHPHAARRLALLKAAITMYASAERDAAYGRGGTANTSRSGRVSGKM